MRERCILPRWDCSNSGRSTLSASSKSRPLHRSSSRVSTIRDRTRCDNDHFANDCPNSQESAIDQLQQLHDLQDNVTAFQFLTADLYENLSGVNSQEPIDHLNITDEDGTTASLPSNMKISGPIELVKYKEVTYLIENHVSQDTNKQNTNTQNIEQSMIGIDTTGDEVNPY